jgi:hypothetical protein
MKKQSRIIHFNSKEIEESNGIYGLIVKTVLEQKGIELDDLKPLYMNKIPGAKISGWTSFKNTLLRVLEKGGEMSFSSFLNWSKLLNIKTAVSAVSYYGEELPDEDFIFDKDSEKVFDGKQENKVIILNDINESIHKEFEELVEEDLEEEVKRVKEFLSYLSPLLSSHITHDQDDSEVCTFLQDKVTEGIKFLNLKYKTSVSVSSEILKDDSKLFVVAVLIENKIVIFTLVKNP